MTEYLRLSDWALSSDGPETRAVVFDLMRNGSIMARDIPFAVRKSMVLAGARITNLPAPSWVDINDRNLSGVHTLPENFTESAYMWRNLIKTDRALTEDETTFTNPHVTSIEAYLRSFAFDFNHKFIGNAHVVGGDKKAFVGIRERLDHPSDWGTLSTNKVNAGGVDMTKTGSVDAFQDFVELLNELLWRVNAPTGDGVVLYVSTEFKWRLDAKVARLAGQGGFSQAQDQFGRTVTHYRGARIEEIGLAADQSTPIITNTETAAGLDGSGTFTSIYAVNYSPGHCAGWTHLELKAVETPDSNGTHRQTLLEWAGGIMCLSRHSLARGYNIKFSA